MEDGEDSADAQRTHAAQSEKNETIDGSIENLIGGMPNLPQDVIAEILVRLPAKAILRFRYVSKSWLSLISSPTFIRNHLAHSTVDPTLANYRLLSSIVIDAFHSNVKHCSLSSVFLDLLTDAVDDDFISSHRDQLIQITESCNGLLCVYSGYLILPHSVFLWNPCLRMSKKLPPLAAAETDDPSYGIGYDELNDDYKVVGLFQSLRRSDVVLLLAVHVYSLKNDSWKKMGDFEGANSLDSPVIYANGMFHFILYFREDDVNTPEWSIMSLDVNTEVFGTVEPPAAEQPHYNGRRRDVSIGILHGCLSFLYSCFGEYADVWVLKEYGVRESWTKLVSIPYFAGPSSDDMRMYRMCFLSDGQYLLGHGCYLVVYDPRDGSFVFPWIHDNGYIISSGIYVESLVPLPS